MQAHEMDAGKEYPFQDQLVKGKKVPINDLSAGSFVELNGKIGRIDTLTQNPHSKRSVLLKITNVGDEEGVLFEGVVPITQRFQTPDRVLTVIYDGFDWKHSGGDDLCT
jgi:hypothetical protein